MRSAPRGLADAYQSALAALLAEQNADGYWTGELSASALSTATAVSALALVQRHTGDVSRFADPVAGGLTWLAHHQDPDGGWGDTTKSHSNISTSMLARAAFHLAGASERYAGCLGRVESWLEQHAGRSAREQTQA